MDCLCRVNVRLLALHLEIKHGGKDGSVQEHAQLGRVNSACAAHGDRGGGTSGKGSHALKAHVCKQA